MKKDCGMCGERKYPKKGYLLCRKCDAPMTKDNPYPTRDRRRRRRKDQ